MQRYESYKASGAEWLGDIPSQWGLKRLKFSIELINRKIPCAQVDKYVGLENIESWTGRNIIGLQEVPPESRTNVFQKNDVLFGKLRPYLAKVWLADRDGYSSTELLVLRTREYLPGYLRYLCISKSFIDAVDGSTFGSKMPRTDWSFIGNLETPIPTKNEQDHIVTFLDQKSAEMDAAIAKKERLIELLHEQKSVLISRAVTRGLNPEAPRRDSGVSWLGRIPAHWHVVPNRYIFREQNERSLKGEETHLSMSQRYGLVPAKDLNVQALLSESYDGAKLCRTGDLVQNRLKAHLAVFAVSPCDGLVSPDYSVFRLQDQTNQAIYFERLFKTPAYLSEFNRRVRGIVVGFLRLYSDDFNAIPALVPPPEEQEKIVAFINRLNSDFGVIQGKIEAEIELLIELKSTVIASAVTGKIKI